MILRAHFFSETAVSTVAPVCHDFTDRTYICSAAVGADFAHVDF